MKKTITIIGANGNMGSNISRNLANGNYQLILAGNNEQKLAEFTTALKNSSNNQDISYTLNNKEAVQKSDIIIPAIWYQNQEQLANEIKEVSTDKIIVSIANPLNETYDGLLTEPTTSAAEELAALLPNAKIVKAFNTTFAADFQNQVLHNQTIDSFIAGDDKNAVKQVEELIKTSGFNPLVVGNLSKSRTLESMMVMLIGLSMKYDYNWLAGWKILTK